MTALLFGSALLVLNSLEQHFVEQDLDEMRAVVDSLATALGQTPTRDAPEALRDRLARAVAGHHGVYFIVMAADGSTLFGTAPADLHEVSRSTTASRSLAESTLHTWTLGERSWRGARLEIDDLSILVAVSMETHLRYLGQLRSKLWIGAAVASALAILIVRLAVQRGHAPLRRISRIVSGVTSEQLHVRLDPKDVPIELDPLVASFNKMLDRLEASFERLSYFQADIAHELRTPVTNLTTQIQVSLSRLRDEGAYREVLYGSLEELERMSRLIGDMLFLARADERKAQTDLDEVDLGAEVADLFEFFDGLADETGVYLSVEGSAPSIHANRPMLRRALSNLISNALRYTPKGGTVTVRLHADAGGVTVLVSNPGLTIDEKHIARLFDRFYRVDPARQHHGDGAGLGLAIVKSIAQAHGGSVGVESADCRTTFTLWLPRAASA